MTTGIGSRVHSSVIDEARARLSEGRAQLEGGGTPRPEPELCKRGRAYTSVGGVQCGLEATALMDDVISIVVAGARDTVEVESCSEAVALVALGGFGRQELAPRSDLDLLFVVESEADNASAFVEAILYGLWDLGVEVGHSVRTVEGTLTWAGAEQSILTSLLDARLLKSGAGSRDGQERLFERLEKGIDELVSQSDVGGALIAAKLRESKRRQERYGETVYLLEPNVKESVGGLRDLHLAMWVGRVRFKTHGIDGLLRMGVLSPAEHRTLSRAYDFLLRVRFELHRTTKRRQDHLRFEHQERIAEILNYVKPGSEEHDHRKHGVERFMRAYYFNARSLRILSQAIVERATQGPGSKAGGTRPAPGGFKLRQGMLSVAGFDHFDTDPSAMIRIFEVAQEEAIEIHPYSKHLLFEKKHALDRHWRRKIEVVDPFLSIIEDPKHDASILEQMHDCGLLKQVIPELSRVTARWQHSLYHVYTVDVHAIKVLNYAKKMRRGDFHERLPFLSRMMESLPRPCVLYLACFLHDIGKGWPREDHSSRGARVARTVGERFEASGSAGWDREDTEDLVWLVQDHLLMSDISQRRDLSDPKLLRQFADAVRSEERLMMLYLLTVADMMGTSPKVWTSWKATLLQEVYVNARASLRSRDGQGARRHLLARRVRAREALLREVGSDARVAEAARAFFDAVPDRYLLAVSTHRMARHIKMWNGVRRSGGLATQVTHLRRDGLSELTLVCPDQPGLLALVAGVLAVHDLSVLSASVFSLGLPNEAPDPPPSCIEGTAGDFVLVPDVPAEGTLALDVMRVTDASGTLCDSAERWARVRRDLQAVFVDGADPSEVIARRIWRTSGIEPHRPAVKTEVEVVREQGDEVVIDVFCEDDVGVLYLIARTLADFDLAITLAKISTQGHRVADGFYVRDAKTGDRVTDGERLSSAASAVKSALESISKPASGPSA